MVFIGPHTSLCTSSKILETLVTSSLGKNVLWCLLWMQVSHTWCNGISFKFMPLTIVSNFIKLAMLRWLNLWCQNVVPSLEDFATFAFSFRTLTLRRYKFFSLHAFATMVLWALFTLQPCFSNSTVKPSEMILLTKMRLFFILGRWRTWMMVIKNTLPLICIMALMLPLLMVSKMVSSPLYTFCGTMDS